MNVLSRACDRRAATHEVEQGQHAQDDHRQRIAVSGRQQAEAFCQGAGDERRHAEGQVAEHIEGR
nr:hypothetical protein [Tanacetum cinerariifolium]